MKEVAYARFHRRHAGMDAGGWVAMPEFLACLKAKGATEEGVRAVVAACPKVSTTAALLRAQV